MHWFTSFTLFKIRTLLEKGRSTSFIACGNYPLGILFKQFHRLKYPFPRLVSPLIFTLYSRLTHILSHILFVKPPNANTFSKEQKHTSKCKGINIPLAKITTSNLNIEFLRHLCATSFNVQLFNVPVK